MYPQVEDWSSERLLADGIGDLRPSVDDAAVSCASDSDLPRGPTSHTVDTFTASGPLQSYDGKSCSDTQQLSELDEALCLFAKETEGSDDLSTYELGVQRFWTLNQECGGDIGQTRGRFMDEVLTAVEKGLDRSIVTERMWSTRKTRARKMIRRHLARVVAGPALEHLKVPVHVSYPRKAGLNTSLAGPAHRPLKVPVTHDPHSRRASLNATFIKSSILQEPSRVLARLELLRSEDESAAIDRLVEEAWNESHAGSTSELAMAGGRTSSNTRKRHGRFREAAIEHMSRETDLICVSRRDSIGAT
ncbi:uncharacterized protein MKK02DRAFT_29776 [Dioszegia hungarica]|uniref:Uncharacterized protein n=1 Tax=Dioszegia hungarica TaxID=4972 RepID=A0AA38HEM8_9TREE|nr:uncharacterized protein MKK02DRAFT_29776 [Dioszegia hungarica]KAI9639797.1 hypothetical protein MKK02DRAFT_29776 [Dioszegia hungarica]